MKKEIDGSKTTEELEEAQNDADETVESALEEAAAAQSIAEELDEIMPSGFDDAVLGAEGIAADALIGGENEAAVVTDIGSCGDFLVEEFSVEANVRRASKYIRIPEKIAAYLFAVVYMAVGALCVAIPEKIEFALPYIVGGALGAGALVQFIFAIITKEYKSVRSNKTASSLILIGLSVMIIIEHEWAHTFIPIVWGVIGLCEAAHAFNLALSRISRGLRPSYYIVKGVIEVAVAFLLLYKPEQYGELHIIVFGVSLIFDGVTATPIIKKFTEGR
ncbi:MAG: hypothetical protein K2L72_02990 [Clostridia bacterium]|nr:hypothetical protein [Clostridia bacterium]